jgi:transposase
MVGTLFVGIDVSGTKNVVCAMTQEGTERLRCTVVNDRPGAEELVHRVIRVLTSHNLDHVVFGLEATGLLAWHLRRYLTEDPSLKSYHPTIHMFNPKVVAGFKDAYNSLPKTDDVDAWVIADRLRFGRLPKQHAVDERYEALQRLTRARFRLVEDLVREKQRFLDVLFLKFSTFTQESPVSRKFGATALALTAGDLLPEQIADMPLEDLAVVINGAAKGRYADPQKVAEAVQKAARSAYRLPKAMADAINVVLATHVTVIRALEGQIKVLDQQIAQLVSTFGHTLGSVKGIGPVYAAGILAEIGDIRRFPTEAALAKFAGLTWTRHQSGKFESQQTRLTRSGNAFLRYYLVEAALSVMVHDPEYRSYYERKKAESKTHGHKRALALTARKLVRLVYVLLRHGRLYDPYRRVGKAASR